MSCYDEDTQLPWLPETASPSHRGKWYYIPLFISLTFSANSETAKLFSSPCFS